MNQKLESRLLEETLTISDADDTTLMAQSKEELKSPLMRVKEESENIGLNSTFIKLRSWQIGGENVETVADFIFLGSRITLDSYCNLEIKMLAPWKKSYDKPR